MHANTVRFASDPPQEITLVCTGTVWPAEIHVEGEIWEQGEVVEATPFRTVREYCLSTDQPKRRIRGGS
jgi:hypothetical protein